MSTTTVSGVHVSPSSTDADERGLATTVHVVTLAAQVLTAGLLHVIVPAVALVLLRDSGSWLRAHIKEQLNFQLTYLVASLALGLLVAVTFGLGAIVALPVLAVLFVADVVCSIRAALAASRGESYRFPLSIRLVG